MQPEANISAHARPGDGASTRRIALVLRYAGKHRKGWIGIIAATLLGTIFSLLAPWPMQILVDHVLGAAPLPAKIGWFAVPSKSGIVAIIALAGLLIAMASYLIDVVNTTIWLRVGQQMIYELAADQFARIQRRSLIFHTTNSVGDLMSRIMGDNWCVYSLVDTLIFTPGHALLLAASMTVILLQINATLTLVAILAAPLMATSAVLFGKSVRKASVAQREVDSQIQSHVHRTLSGMSVVQLFAQESREHGQFIRFANGAIRAQRRTTLIQSFSELFSGLGNTLGTAVILWLGAREVLAGRLTLGELLVYLAYLGSLQVQFTSLAGLYTKLQATRANIDRVAEILEVEPEVKNAAGAKVVNSLRGHVCIDRVSFGYESSRPVLSEVSLEAMPGEMIAIVGPTGAGKSTLMGLVPRLFDPWQGRLTIDGQDVRSLTVESLRQQIAIVLQEPFLFPISIAENIAFGRPGASTEQIVQAAKTAGAHEFISRMPQGYNSVIGEHGATLSGGERQRIAIARALLRDAPILILDEPTSGLDAATESALLAALDRLMEGRTVLVIAHRLSTIRRASRIFVMDRGRVVEQGSHDQLLGRRGLYARLHSLQMGTKNAVSTNGVMESVAPVG